MEQADQEELLRRRVADEVRDSVRESLKTEFRWLGIIVAFLLGGGTLLTANNLLSASREKLAVAEALQDRSNKTLDRLDGALAKIDRLVSESDSISSRQQAISARAGAIEQSIAASQGQAIQISEKLGAQLTALTAQVQEIIAAQTKLAPNAGRDRTGAILLALQRTQEDIQRAAIQADLSQYSVVLSNFQNATQFQRSLTTKGYNVRIFAEPEVTDLDGNSTIAIGRKVPPTVAAPLIKQAKEAYPFLRYVRFVNHPGDNVWPETQIGIGATTKRSIDQGVRPATEAEFAKLSNAALPLAEFQQLIQSLYQPALPDKKR